MRATMVLCSILFSAATALTAVPVRLLTTWGDEDAEQTAPEQVTVDLTPAGAENESLETKKLQLTVPGEVLVDLPAETLWRVDAAAPRVWARSWVFAVSTAASEQVVQLHPTGFVAGTLEAKPESPEVRELTVRFQAPSKGFVAATSICPIDEAGSWRCELPVGEFDLRLGARGYAPRYYWGVEVEREEPRRLGRLDLRPGASLAGTVVLGERGGTAPDQGVSVTVHLRPATVPAASGEVEPERFQQFRRSVTANENGHFQFTELDSGDYFLTCEAPHFAKASIGPVSVYAPNESLLDEPIVLRPPASFEAVVHPPLSPTGDPWRLWLRPRPSPGQDFTLSLGGYVETDGSWKVDGLPEGGYYLTVFSATTEWLTEEVEVQAGVPAHQVEVPVVRVEGELQWRGEPRPLSLWFVEVGTQKRTRFQLDENEFEGYLPYEGTWQVLLYDPPSRRRFFLEPVDVEVSQASGVARVEIEVPDGTIHGKVIDTRGEGVEGIQVNLGVSQDPGLPSTAWTNSEGEFHFELLAADSYEVSVEDQRYAEVRQSVELQEGFEPPPVILRLEEEEAMTVRVSAGGVPLPGTLILGTPPSLGYRRIQVGTTDVTGQAELKFPKGSSQLMVVVFPPGYAARWMAMDARQGLVEVPVDYVGGSLTITWSPRPAFNAGPLMFQPMIQHEGMVLPLGMFQRWESERGMWEPGQGRVTIPMLNPGTYTVCAPAEESGPGDKGVEETCRSGFLAPSGDLVLRLP